MTEKKSSWVEQECIKRGLKMTGQRRIIAQVIAAAEDHPDIEEIYQRVQKQDSNVSIATVYRTIRLFEEKGIIIKRDFGDGKSRLDHGEHDHIIDMDTGDIIEFDCSELHLLYQKIATQYGYKLENTQVKLYGRKNATNTKRD